MLKRFDKDGNGELSDEERAAMRQELGQRRRGGGQGQGPGGQRRGGPGQGQRPGGQRPSDA